MDPLKRVLITDHGFPNVDHERAILNPAGVELSVAQCKTEDDVIEMAKGAGALLVQWAPITSRVVASLPDCRLIVRYGIGVDNVDLGAAKDQGIAVSNVPDYGVNEVAEHALSLGLSLARQLPQLDSRLRLGVWKHNPDVPIWSFAELTFATAGFGRIARAAQEKARSLGFKRIAYDPFVSEETFAEAGVERVSLENLFLRADILSLHLPLLPETRHLLNAERIGSMKRSAIVINTARGGLIDSIALADALNNRKLGGAGLDVFEQEPLPANDRLRDCPNTILTSHVAWYSESSVPRLQRMAAEEALRGLRSETLRYRVNG